MSYRRDFPGLGLPFHYLSQDDDDFYPTGHHNDCLGALSEIIQVREVAMMHIMDRLTDREDWHKKVFDEKVVAKWREEALAYSDMELWQIASYDRDSLPKPVTGIINEATFDYCVQELQCKARYFIETGIIPTMEATASIAKSDTIIEAPLSSALRSAFARLKKDQAADPVWEPETDEKVLSIVHPTMHLLVDGNTKLFQDAVVGVTDAIDKWAGKGDTIFNQPYAARDYFLDYMHNVPLDFWSDMYQWLPSNVALNDDGSVSFRSYINNLHPRKYPEIYRTIEKLVEKAIPMWDQVLRIIVGEGQHVKAGRTALRLPIPSDPSDQNSANWFPPSWRDLSLVETPEDRASRDNSDEADEKKWLELRRPLYTEPEAFKEIDYSPRPSRRLREVFPDLQIIVKMVSIELTPEKPTYPVGPWHVEGQMNEHICATAIYHLDSENITTSSLSFRMATEPDILETDGYRVGQKGYHWLQSVHATCLNGDPGYCFQNYGSVQTPQGRFLAYPNVFQRQESSFRLVDPTKPGHSHIIVLYLVDPHLPIVSTANVPPQQLDWWLEATFGKTVEEQEAALGKLPAELVQLLRDKNMLGKAKPNFAGGRKLPQELTDMVRSYFDFETFDLMSRDDMEAHMENSTYERRKINEDLQENWEIAGYR